MNISHTMIALMVVLSIAGLPLSIGVSGDSTETYQIGVDGAIETPTRTVTLDGEAFQVSEIAAVKPGTPIDVKVSAPAGQTYDLNVYNAQKEIVTVREGAGSRQLTVQTDGFNVGTYFLALYVDGTFEKIYPLVLSEYSLSLEAPRSVSTESTVEVAVSLTGKGAPTSVSIVALSDETSQRIRATKGSDNTYRASFTVSAFTADTISVYAIAQSEQVVNGRHEIVGVSDSASVELTRQTATATTNDETGSEGAVQSPTTEPPKPTETTTAVKQTSQPETTRPPTRSPSETTRSPEPATTLTTDSSVITPNPRTQTAVSSTTQTSGQAGFTLITVLLSSGTIAFLARRIS